MRGGAGRGRGLGVGGALEWAGLKGQMASEGPNVKGGGGLACAKPISVQGAKGVWSGGGGGALSELIGRCRWAEFKHRGRGL